MKDSVTTIFIDSKPYKTAKKKVIGADIKAMSGIDAHYQLYLENPTDDGDKPVGDLQSVKITNGLHFYAIPSCTQA